MDKQWMKAPRWSIEYDEGLRHYIQFAFASAQHNRIPCPCRGCGNNYWLGAKDVWEHLISIGFMDGYSSWIHHGEGMSSVPSPARSQSEDDEVAIDPMEQMLMEGFGMYDAGALGEEEGFEDEDEDEVDAEAYYKLVRDRSQELYPGCKTFSKLQFLISLLTLKNRWGMSNGYYHELLPLIKEALPKGEVLPKNFHEAKRFGKAIGIGYYCIDACRNVGSARISEAIFEVQEVKEENKKIWDVVQTLMSNQTKLEQQYNELKSQVSGTQRCPSVDSSPRVGTIARQHLQDMNDDNQESVSHSNRRHGAEPEETRNGVLPSLQKRKRNTSQHTLMENTKDRTPSQSLPEISKKPRKFQTPLHRDMEDIKCGMEVGLASPSSKKLVALRTIQKTDMKAKANDGQPLADYIEVLVTIVYKQTTILPLAHGKIQNLGSATAHCIPWPRQNIICADGTPLHSKLCSSNGKITLKTRGTAGSKRSTSKADITGLNEDQVVSQSLPEIKQARRHVKKK